MLKKLLILSIFLSGCTTFSVSHVIPEPNINIPESEQTLGFELDTDIEDAYNNHTVRVRHWRDSVESGFQRAFSQSYHFSKSSPDLILVIKKAELRIDPTGYYQSPYSSGPEPSGYQATIEYSASLKNRSGRVLTRTADTAKAKRPFVNMKDANDSVKTALEDMYEKIAHDLF